MESLLKQIKKFDEPHVSIEIPEDDELKSIFFSLYVTEGIHRGATYTFECIFRTNGEFLKSQSPPIIYCRSSIYHPNIVEDDALCCNVLGDDWEPGTKLTGIVAAIYCLLENPEFGNALHAGIDEENYETDVQNGINYAG